MFRFYYHFPTMACSTILSIFVQKHVIVLAWHTHPTSIVDEVSICYILPPRITGCWAVHLNQTVCVSITCISLCAYLIPCGICTDSLIHSAWEFLSTSSTNRGIPSCLVPQTGGKILSPGREDDGTHPEMGSKGWFVDVLRGLVDQRPFLEALVERRNE